jgi:hypothetical protein
MRKINGGRRKDKIVCDSNEIALATFAHHAGEQGK